MSVAIVKGRPDNLDEAARRFDRERLTQPVFLNSVPKSGTHLLRNIMRMFVAEDQHWRREFIQHPILSRSLDAFDVEAPLISWGHLLFSDDAAVALKPARHIVLVRDPYDWVTACARFHVSDEFKGPLSRLKDGKVHAEDVLNMMIFGVPGLLPGLTDIYTFNAAAWMGGKAVFVRYEDIVANVQDLGSNRAEAFFTQLLSDCGLSKPTDWRERVETGADRRQSRTAREHLNLTIPVPSELPPTQRRMVDFAAPGLRALLGYA